MMAELFMAYKITEIVIFSFKHLIWSGILGYFEPVPFNLLISGCLSAIGMIIRTHQQEKDTRHMLYIGFGLSSSTSNWHFSKTSHYFGSFNG